MKKETFEYKDIDFIESPIGWLEASIENRLSEGFEIRRDEEKMSWKGIKYLNERPTTI